MGAREGNDYAIAMPGSGEYVSSVKRPVEETTEHLGCARWFRDLRTVRRHADRLGGVVVRVPTESDAALGDGPYNGPWRP